MSAKLPKTDDLLYVIWRDTTNTPGWHRAGEALDIADDMDDMLCESAGFLLKATKTTLSLAMNAGVNREDAHNILKIPRGSVISAWRVGATSRRILWK